jgi:hypothetical protein
LTPLDIFLLGYVKDPVYMSPISAKLNELKTKMKCAAVSVISSDAKCVDGTEILTDVCEVTNGARIK